MYNSVLMHWSHDHLKWSCWEFCTLTYPWQIPSMTTNLDHHVISPLVDITTKSTPAPILAWNEPNTDYTNTPYKTFYPWEMKWVHYCFWCVQFPTCYWLLTLSCLLVSVITHTFTMCTLILYSDGWSTLSIWVHELLFSTFSGLWVTLLFDILNNLSLTVFRQLFY